MTPDAALLERHKPGTLPAPEPGCYVNWLGIQTDASLFPGLPDLAGKTIADIPMGGDGVYGGYWEYAAVLTALENIRGRERIVAVELGAGWGPWISAAGMAARRRGMEADLIGVEADSGKCDLMRQHLARNGLTGTVMHGAAWYKNDTLSFPKIDSRADHGAAASHTGGYTMKDGLPVDYRGQKMDPIHVSAYSVETIVGKRQVVDVMHMDVQGAEGAIADRCIEFLGKTVRYLFIGTHSRLIEGEILERFFKAGWDLIHQTPCHFVWDRNKPSLVGMIHTDGELFFRNPKLT